MESSFRNVIEHIFQNWTALRLAVEYSENLANSNETVEQFVQYMVKYCLYTNNVTEDCIQEALDDIMDQEFETICEDNSTKEIAKILYKFLDLLKQQNVEEFQAEYNKLPISQVATTSKLTQNGNSRKKVEESDSSDLDSESPMEEDSGWVTVKSRRKH